MGRSLLWLLPRPSTGAKKPTGAPPKSWKATSHCSPSCPSCCCSRPVRGQRHRAATVSLTTWSCRCGWVECPGALHVHIGPGPSPAQGDSSASEPRHRAFGEGSSRCCPHRAPLRAQRGTKVMWPGRGTNGTLLSPQQPTSSHCPSQGTPSLGFALSQRLHVLSHK